MSHSLHDNMQSHLGRQAGRQTLVEGKMRKASVMKLVRPKEESDAYDYDLLRSSREADTTTS